MLEPRRPGFAAEAPPVLRRRKGGRSDQGFVRPSGMLAGCRPGGWVRRTAWRAGPCEPCSQAASTASGSQPQRSASRRPRSSRSVPRSASSRCRRLAFTRFLPPLGHPVGIDGRDGPASQPAQESRPCDAIGIGVVGVARQRPRGQADCDRVPPEPTEKLARRPMSARSGRPPRRFGNQRRAARRDLASASIAPASIQGRAGRIERVFERQMPPSTRRRARRASSAQNVRAVSGRNGIRSSRASGCRNFFRRWWSTRVDTHRAGSFPTTEAATFLFDQSPHSASRQSQPSRHHVEIESMDRWSADQTGLHIQESADAPHQFIDIERLVQEIVRSRLA